MTLSKVCPDLSKMLAKRCQSMGTCRFMNLAEFEEVTRSVPITLESEARHVKECMQEPTMHVSGDFRAVTK